jgi:hypothetical protein
VLVLETVLFVGLWARRRWIFWPVLAQFVLFHLMSFSIVGWFYPLLMFAILAIFPLERIRAPNEGAGAPAWLPRGVPPAAWAWAAGFSALQLVPYLFPGDPALTGEGRLFSLNMFDAKVECLAHAVLRLRSGETRDVQLWRPLAQRIQCDPLVYYSRAHLLCERHRGRADFADLDLELLSKKASEQGFRPVVQVANFCQAQIRYSLFHPNAWIRKGDAP